MFPVPLTPANLSAPAANTAAVVTFAIDGAGRAHVLTWVAWSYDGAPTGGSLKIEDGTGNIGFQVAITAAGPGEFVFDPPLQGSFNTALIVTLAAGGGGVTGRLNCGGHYTTPNRPMDASVLYGGNRGVVDFSDNDNSEYAPLLHGLY